MSANNKICIRLCGGLGNQLFQYAFGKSLSARGATVCFDLANGFKHDPYRRRYSLQEFKCAVTSVDSEDIPWCVTWRPPWHRLAKTLLNMYPEALRQVYYEKMPFAYEAQAVYASPRARYYWGYWQNAAYLNANGDVLREEVRLDEESDLFKKLQKEISARKAISVHVRTYRDLGRNGQVIKSAGQNHGACEVQYYARAVATVPDHQRHHAYIFTDDLEWTKDILRLPVPCTYIADCGPLSAAEELMLMAACRSHVISNSSFSWWGAWLGKAPNQTVVAPKIWNKSIKGDQSGVCPPDWIRL